MKASFQEIGLRNLEMVALKAFAEIGLVNLFEGTGYSYCSAAVLNFMYVSSNVFLIATNIEVIFKLNRKKTGEKCLDISKEDSLVEPIAEK